MPRHPVLVTFALCASSGTSASPATTPADLAAAYAEAGNFEE